jgi:hypothetical protein
MKKEEEEEEEEEEEKEEEEEEEKEEEEEDCERKLRCVERHVYNPSTQEAEAGKSVNSRPTWLHSKTLSHEIKTLCMVVQSYKPDPWEAKAGFQ